MEKLLLLLTFVFFILQIVLFFKHWGMIDNVKEMNRKMKGYEDFEYYVWIGEKEKAYESLCKEMYEKIHYMTGWSSISQGTDAPADFEEKIVKCINQYKKKFEIIGRSVPENLSSVEKIKYMGSKLES